MIEAPPPPTRSDDAGPPLTVKGCLGPMQAFLGAVGAALLLAIGLLVGRCTGDAPAPAASTTVVKRGPNVVIAIRDLARLEGASFHMERVIDLKEKQNRFQGLVTAEDAILLVAAGDVVAGVDLSQMNAEDIRVDEATKRVKVVLPRATVFSASLDNQNTYVHTRSTDLLARRQEALETRARQEAERTLEQNAIEAGILARAERNVARTIEILIRSLGFQDVEVSYQSAPEAR